MGPNLASKRSRVSGSAGFICFYTRYTKRNVVASHSQWVGVDCNGFNFYVLLWAVLAVSGHFFNSLQHVEPINDLPKHRVLACGSHVGAALHHGCAPQQDGPLSDGCLANVMKN